MKKKGNIIQRFFDSIASLAPKNIDHAYHAIQFAERNGGYNRSNSFQDLQEDIQNSESQEQQFYLYAMYPYSNMF